MTEPRARILFIDDDTALGRLVQRDLERCGYGVEAALSGPAGIERLKAGAFDVVVLDHYMPGQDGLETLAQMRGLAAPPPVVYLTGTAEGRVAVAALKQGAVNYVVKDLEGHFLPLLRSAVAGAIEAAELRRARAAAEAELRFSRDRFEALAEERAVLMQEVNHRVGNSLQLVASLLSLQANASREAVVKAALATASSRVMAISEMHRRLHTSGDVTSVALDRYLGALIEDFKRAIENEDAVRLLTYAGDEITTTPDRAVAIGVIASELLLNATKYAYPGGSGPIRVRLSRGGPRAMTLQVEDDGVGQEAAGAAAGTGLGRRIIQAMALKLGATVTTDPAHRGMRVVVEVPDQPVRAPAGMA